MKLALSTLLFVFAVTLVCCGSPPPPAPVPTTAANVRLDKQLDSDTARYRVENASGADQGKASDAAAVAALVFCAKSVAGDPREKTAAGAYVRNNLLKLMPMANKGKIFRRGFNAAGDKMAVAMFIKINRSNLQRHLVENQVITESRKISKAAGKPKIMVIYEQGDCKRGKGLGDLCTLPKKIKAEAAKVAAEEAKVAKHQKAIIEAKCLEPVKKEESTEASMKDKSRASSSRSSRGSHSRSSRGSHSRSASSSSSVHGARSGRSGYISGRRSGRYSSRGSHASSSRGSHASSSRSSIALNREAKYKHFKSSVKPSPHCRKFIARLDTLEERVDRAQAKLDAIQDKLDAARGELQKKDQATIKVNEWFVNQRWEVVDANAVLKAQRMVDAMGNVKGLAEDPVARIAQLAGADIYVMHNAQESTAGGGFQIHLDVRAYEVVSGKLLGSKVGKSNKLASRELANATSQAVGRAMPKILDQMTAYWSDMAKEGVKCKVVLRGDFSNNRMRRKANRAIRDLGDTIGKKCAGKCEWEKGMATAQTISGEFVSPPKVRRDIGEYLTEALEEAGFRVSIVISNNALNMLEVM